MELIWFIFFLNLINDVRTEKPICFKTLNNRNFGGLWSANILLVKLLYLYPLSHKQHVEYYNLFFNDYENYSNSKMLIYVFLGSDAFEDLRVYILWDKSNLEHLNSFRSLEVITKPLFVWYTGASAYVLINLAHSTPSPCLSFWFQLLEKSISDIE